MYLKKLEMKGFKSFADKTEISFEDGVTCIVGPNGSGKSNITDAVRWVLGEQKIKTLRGSKMEDVIFNGTNRRKALGYAEVSLFFDNSGRIFPYDFSEIVVSRKLYRSGESEYLLNNTQCRLKEVRELFMDTGIGTDGYSIIGQGRIERILSSNKDERRAIFEEAAGIAKYKSRKNEAERKLFNTDTNLERIEDIVSEIQGRIEPLKTESKKAIEYKEISKKLKEIEINQLVNTYGRNEKKLNNENEKIIEIKKNLEESNLLMDKINDEYSTGVLKFDEFNEKLKNINENYFNCSNRIKEIEGEKKLIEEKLNNMELNFSRIKDDIKENSNLIIEKDKVLIELNSNKKTVYDSINLLKNEKDEIESTYSTVLEDYNITENKITEDRNEIINILNSIEREKNEVSNFQRNLETFENRKSEADKELSNIISKIRDFNKTLFEKEIEITDINNIVSNIEAKKNSLENEISKEKLLIEKKESEIRNLESEITRRKSEKNILISMDEEYEGFDNSVKNALKKCDQDKSMGRGITGVIASLFNVDKKYEKSIEVSLGKSLQNIVCENEDDAKRVINYLKNKKLGRVTFLPISNVKSRGDDKRNLSDLALAKGYLGKANELISYDKKYRDIFSNLLGRIIIVDSYENAVKILKIKNLKYKIVTLSGEILVPGGSITGGSFRSNLSNILSRKRKIVELGELIINLSDRFEKEIYSLKDLKNQVNIKGASIKEMDFNISNYKLKLVEKNGEFTRINGEISTFNFEKNKLIKEDALINSQLELSKMNIEKTKKNIETFKLSHESLLKSMEEEIERMKSVDEHIKKYQNQVTAIKIKLASSTEKANNIDKEIIRFQEEKTSVENILKNLKERLSEIFEAKKILVEETKIIYENLKKKKIESEELILQKKEFQDIKMTSDKLILSKREELEKVSKTIIDKKDSLHKFDINIARFEMEKENIIKEIWEKYELSINEALTFKKDDDFKDSIKEVKNIKKRIAELGDINLGSIREYEEVKERYDFLCEQKSDLIKAQKSLKKIIKDLEILMKEQFIEHFEIVRSHFKDIFLELFSGGKADLVIEDMDNILESDISILAQPMGKKLQDLSLMSGGEKSLTAITLLFSILKSKPAPFCILDEIEAALDDINVVRFAEFLKKFTRNSQFVIITHRKGTMEMADILYGITMEEYGVSKMVSVKLEDVV